MGSTGFQGLQGSTGIQGFQGSLGFQGGMGSTGFQGLQGSTGIQGFQGTQGFQGSVGFQGIIGPTGADGFLGGTGSTGPQGFQGIIGPTGFQGFQGRQGNQGNQGNQGFQGRQGNQGFQGQGFNVVSNYGSNRILVSDGTTFGATAQTNLTYDGQTLTIIGSNLGDTILSVEGVSGPLFTIVDSLTGALLEVGSTSSNIFEVNSSGYLFTNTRGLTGLTSGGSPHLLYEITKTVGDGAFFDYWVYDTSNFGKRVGTVSCVWDDSNDNIAYTDVSTVDINSSTSNIEFYTGITNDNVQLKVEISGGIWDIKISARVI